MSKIIEVLVDGMTCSNCALTITKYLESKGAKDVQANPMTGDVSFSVLESDDENKLLDGIDNIGYKVHRSDGADHVHILENSFLDNRLFSIPFYLWLATLFCLPFWLHMFVNISFFHHFYFQCILASIVFFIGMRKFLKIAIQSIKNKLATMEVLIVVGATAAFVYSIIGWFLFHENFQNYNFFETSASILVLVMWGNFLEEYTIKSTTSAIKDLMKLKVDEVTMVWKDSIGKFSFQKIKSEFLKIGDLILIKDGEAVGADGNIIEGEALIDEHVFTGESMPVRKLVGDKVYTGTVLMKGNIQVEVEKLAKNNAINEIIKVVKKAQSSKPNIQKLADKIAAVFVPLVIIIAILTFFITYFFVNHDAQNAMMRAIAVLVISCPCAMGLATPAAVMVGLGRASSMGVLVKKGDVLEILNTIKYVVFDKTGTLTSKNMDVKFNFYETENPFFLSLIKSIESFSSHPIAHSIVQKLNDVNLIEKGLKVQEEKAKGMQADYENKKYYLGSSAWMKEMGIDIKDSREDIFLVEGQKILVSISLSEELDPASISVISYLKNRGIKCVLLSGDKKEKVEIVANKLGIDEYYFAQSPIEKMQKIKYLQQNGKLMMIGDGINDSPALALADIGVSMNEATDVAQSTSDIVLINQGIASLPKAFEIGVATYNTIKQNLFWAFIYNIIAIPVAFLGLLKPTMGAGIMALSDVFLILNSLRLKFKKIQ